MPRNHRGVSAVVGSLFMLAIVVPIGVIVLTQGMNESVQFTQKISMNSDRMVQAVQEDLIFEHVRFVPSTDEVIISLRNTGTVETSINKITIVKMDTQELLLLEDNLAPFLSLEDVGDISVNANLLPARWDDPNYKDSQYKISIVTSRGNFFDIIARPYNT